MTAKQYSSRGASTRESVALAKGLEMAPHNTTPSKSVIIATFSVAECIGANANVFRVNARQDGGRNPLLVCGG